MLSSAGWRRPAKFTTLRLKFAAASSQPRIKSSSSASKTPETPEDLFPTHQVYSSENLNLPHLKTVGREGSPFKYLLVPHLRPWATNTCGTPRIVFRLSGSRMATFYQIATTPTADTPGFALIVSFGNGDRYLFGQLAEGTQRALVQRRMSMTRIVSMFITGPITWHSTGGLLGMVLTVADTRKEALASGAEHNRKRIERGAEPRDYSARPLSIFGGKNLTHMIASARHFVFRTGVPIKAHEIANHAATSSRESSAPDFTDENIRVWYVPLTPRSGLGRGVPVETEQEALDQRTREAVVHSMFGSGWTLDTLRETNLYDAKLPCKIFVRGENGRIQKYEGPLPNEDKDCPNIKVLVRDPWPSATVRELPPATPSRTSMCYIVKNHRRRGRFNPEIAISLGAQRADFKKLTDGETVMGKDGIAVTPDMVMGPSVPGSGVVIVEIRTEDLIEDFLQRPEWSNTEIMDGIGTVYWILSQEVQTEARLIAWMKAHPQITHRLISPGTSPNRIALESPGAQLIKMHMIDPDRFIIPNHSNVEGPMLPALAEVAQVPPLGEKLQLVPRVEVRAEGIVPLMDTRTPINEIAQDDKIMALVAEARNKIAQPDFKARVEESERGKPTDDVEVISLGTGSALPSKYRNVSATLIHVPSCGSYLLDCGENTLGQLRRVYGYEGADRVLRDLRAIYISHNHADHHLGTASVLARRAELVKADPTIPPAALVACENFHRWFAEYGSIEDMGAPDHVERIICWPNRPLERQRAKIGQIDLPSIDTVYVDHCHNSTAVVMTWPSGLKIAYSGDCRPSASFAQLGKGAHLLIHEATFDSELTGEALAKKHSTVAEALEVGRQMEADKILLTHFSQRYPKLPVVENTGQTVLCAFDLMRVKLKEFEYAQAFMPALRLLLAEEEPSADNAESGPAKKKAKNGDETPSEPVPSAGPLGKKAAKKALNREKEEAARKAEEARQAEEAARKAEEERIEEEKSLVKERRVEERKALESRPKSPQQEGKSWDAVFEKR